MPLSERFTLDLKDALKSKDSLRASCLRMLKTAVKNQEVEKMRALTDEEILSVLASMIKKGKDAAEEFRKGGRAELAAKEEQEVEIYYAYMPKQLSPEEVEGVLQQVIADLGAKGPKDLGRVMNEAMKRMAGQAQGKEVNVIVRRLLS